MEPILPLLNIWKILLIIATGQGFFLSILLFSSLRKKGKELVWIASLILVFSLILLDYLGFWTAAHLVFSHFATSYFCLTFLVGPLFYFYFKNLLLNKLPQKSNWLHFLPAILVFLFQLPFYASSHTEKIKILDQKADYPFLFPVTYQDWSNTIDILIVLHLFAYLVTSYQLFQKHKIRISHISRSFLNTFLSLFFAFSFSYLTYIIIIRTPYFILLYDYCIALVMILSIYTIAFLAYKKPEIFENQSIKAALKPQKYKNSGLTPSAAASLKNRLESYLEKEEVFLQNDLRLATLATELGISVHHLSQLINEQYQKSFTNFINERRIKKAKSLLSNPNLQIKEIAYQVGFNNKTSFYKAFKKETQISPSEFRKKNLENELNMGQLL